MYLILQFRHSLLSVENRLIFACHYYSLEMLSDLLGIIKEPNNKNPQQERYNHDQIDMGLLGLIFFVTCVIVFFAVELLLWKVFWGLVGVIGLLAFIDRIFSGKVHKIMQITSLSVFILLFMWVIWASIKLSMSISHTWGKALILIPGIVISLYFTVAIGLKLRKKTNSE